jgi:hypothetical protein
MDTSDSDGWSSKSSMISQDISNRHVILFTFIIAMAMCLWMVLLQPVKIAVEFSVIDDAMYYFSIAQNFVAKGFFTYDGITATNGFHPLWELMLIPFAYSVRDPLMLLRVGFVLSALFFLGSLLLFYRVTGQLKLTSVGMFAAFIIIFGNLRSFTLWFSLMESALLLLLYFCYLAFAISAGEKRFTEPRMIFGAGFLIGIIFLARADSFLLFFFYVALLIRYHTNKKSGSFVMPLLSALAGVAIPVIPYLAYNYVRFGKLQTVSSWQKFYIPSLDTILRPLRRFYHETIYRYMYVFNLPNLFQVLILIAVVGSIAATLYVIWRMRNRLSESLNSVNDFIIFALVHFVLVYLFVPYEAIFSVWYHVPEIAAAGLVVGFAFGSLFKDFSPMYSKIFRFGCAAFLIWQFYFYPSFVGKKTMTAAKMEMAQNVARIVPAADPVAMYDAGIVSYFSQHPFIPLNGLVGDFEIARICSNRDFGLLFDKFGIRYLVVDVPVAMLPGLPGKILSMTSIRTEMMSMYEGPKQLFLFQIDSTQVNEFFEIREGKK